MEKSCQEKQDAEIQVLQSLYVNDVQDLRTKEAFKV